MTGLILWAIYGTLWIIVFQLRTIIKDIKKP